MAYFQADRIRMNCTPSGLGDIVLSTTPLGYLSMDDAGAQDGDTCTLCTVVPVTGEFIVYEATYNAAGTSITRGTILRNHLGTTANVDFTGGSAGVTFCGLSAENALHDHMTAAQFFAAGVVPVPTGATITATGTDQAGAATITTRRTYINSGGANTGVKLRSTTDDPIGTEGLVVNKTATDKIFYPDSGSNFDALSADVGITLSPGQGMWYDRTGATQWYVY